MSLPMSWLARLLRCLVPRGGHGEARDGLGLGVPVLDDTGCLIREELCHWSRVWDYMEELFHTSLIHYNIGPSTANLWSKLIVSIVLRGNSNVGLYDNKIRACWWTRGEHISRPTVFINLLSFTRRNAKAYLTLGSKQTFPRQMVALRVTFRA